MIKIISRQGEYSVSDEVWEYGKIILTIIKFQIINTNLCKYELGLYEFRFSPLTDVSLIQSLLNLGVVITINISGARVIVQQ